MSRELFEQLFTALYMYYRERWATPTMAQADVQLLVKKVTEEMELIEKAME